METGDRIDAGRRPGRGAGANPAGRFEPYARLREPDGWEIEEELPPLRTEVRVERPRRVVTRNDSPDLGFDRSINPYRGCEHGCIYCFARPGHGYLGMSSGLDFETRLIARPTAPARLAEELAQPRYRVAPIAIGTNTDPYQPIERDNRIMRGLLEVLRDFRHPVTVVTKGTLIERDIDLLAEMAADGLASVGVSITTLDPDLGRRMEPRVPAPHRRLKTVARLTEAGIPVRVMVSPVVPGLTDQEIEAILAAARDAGARAASWIMLRLPHEVAPLFEDWLAEHYPDRRDKVLRRLREMHGGKLYEARFGHRMRGEGIHARMIAERFDLAARRLGLDGPMPGLRTNLFRVPPRVGDQLTLF
ncbi:PA0069 family radical SAM protein [Mesobaculum littorinae]|uniref:PA0069 family radical SAM protein n=1 Tax=Mesobaculum littorinae TaxID=2486419 RepID=A0A438AJG8_9RHOB|nr:PA0069 family radical SAM protein [Mesobaculum littorinae]RVV98799.1 PA0069 family radical SAM protein [Mesobaculum littorinae]